MKNTLSNEQIEQYRNDGFLFYPGLLSPDEVAELKGAVLETALLFQGLHPAAQPLAAE
jgi:hypothetical protein